METRYQITGYHLVYADGRRDGVKLQTPELVEDLEEYRRLVKDKHECTVVNLNYVELNY